MSRFVVALPCSRSAVSPGRTIPRRKMGDLAKLAGTWKTMAGPNKDIP